jgi:6-phosphogluconate dehydrogenase (decarboxylating)
MTSGQICSHGNVIQSWLIGFTAEDESAQPHVQKYPVLNFTQGAVFHVILDI